MSNIKDQALELINNQLSVIPTKDDKTPATTWKPYQSKIMKADEVETLFVGAKGLGIICGAISGNLEVIDVDIKHDLTGSLWDDFNSLLQDNLPEIYNSLVIAQTKSGGYHIYYRCSSIGGNAKLANNTNKEVLIETRGQGGYVIAYPTPGYTYIQGEPKNIATITAKEREIIFNIAKSLNELDEPEIKLPTTSAKNNNFTGLTPFDDYNQKGDVVELLVSKGWKEVNRKGQRINLLRPGSTDSKTSGNFHIEKRTLRVFSTSTEFNTDKAYSPAQVFTLLECKGDYQLSYKRLLEMGYGKPYKGESYQTTQLKTEKIEVKTVNKVSQENIVISSPGDTLKIENIQNAIGDEIIIYTPGAEAQEEVIKTIELGLQTGKRIYIQELLEIEVREYKYLLQAIHNKYVKLHSEKGFITDRERDSYLDEVVILSNKLQPIDSDQFIKLFISTDYAQELGVEEKTIQDTVTRLRKDQELRDQATATKELLAEATKHLTSGEINKALELLETKVKDVKLKDKETEFSSLMKPIKEAELKERQINKPTSISSGYTIAKEPLLLPAGAISFFAAPTSHGKTSFLINLALNAVELYPDKEFYLFSYEEDGDSILIKTLNTYINKDLSKNNKRSIDSYFANGSTEFINEKLQKDFIATKDKFFNELIETRRLNINYSSYDSGTLIDAIRYIHKNGKPGAIFIDYTQLLNLPDGKHKTYSRQEEMKQICISLKDLAVETGLPLVLGAQFNRKVTDPTKLHPTNIGEAGDIERIANLIVGFWNTAFKAFDNSDDKLTEVFKETGVRLGVPGQMYVELLKNRGGAVGLNDVFEFNGNTGKIKNSEKPESSGGITFGE